MRFVQKEDIAEACHEVNRQYCMAMGDLTQLPWKMAPEWQRSSARMGVDLHTTTAPFGAVGYQDFPPEASHLSWMMEKRNEGWVYGDAKDAELKTHPCMVAFKDLPPYQQAKDYISRAVVHAMRPFLTPDPKGL